MLSQRWILCGVVVSLLGCAGPRTYGVRFNLEGQRQVDLASTPPSPEVATILRGATTLAFNPPDACRDVKAAGAGASEVSNVMRLSCGVLMTELEGAAAREGFQVVSWQTLRGSAPAITYAKENHVDVLFELNDLSFDVPVQDLYTFTDVSFFSRDDKTNAIKPLVVSDALGTGKRCQEQFLKNFDPTLTVTLDAKMVTVADGRVRWAFRDTRRERADEHVQVTRTWLAHPAGSNGFSDVGLPLFSAGAGVWLAGFLISNIEGKDSLTDTFQTVGLIGAASGVALALVGLALPAEYPPGADVLCQGPALEDRLVVGPTVTPGAASSVSFSEQHQVQGRQEEVRRKKLMNTVTQGFIDTIAKMRRSAPPPPPPPPPGAPLSPVPFPQP